MTQVTINNGDTGAAARAAINANLTEVYNGLRPAVPKIGFAGDSIMNRLQFDNGSSGLWQAMLDRPRVYNWDPMATGSTANSGSASGNTNPTDLVHATNIANQQSYAADIIFGLTGGNDGGTTIYQTVTNVQTFANAIWSAKPSTRIVWHCPTPQVRSATGSYSNLQAMRSELREMERRDRRFYLSDVSEYMVDPLTNFQPFSTDTTTAGLNVLGGVVDTTNGQHPTGAWGWATRTHYDKILDKLGVPEMWDMPIPTIGSIYNSSTNPGANLLIGNGTAGPMGTFNGSQTPFGSPANWQGTIAAKWDPITPGEIVCQGTAGSSITMPSGRSLNALKLQLNTGTATTTAINTAGITRNGIPWASGAASPVTARFYAYIYLEAVVGISSLNITIVGTIGGVAGKTYAFGGTNNKLCDVWNYGNAVTRLCRIALPVNFSFDTGTNWAVTASASFPAGIIPSGNIYFAAFTMEPILSGF